jgi:hypothetical protein
LEAGGKQMFCDPEDGSDIFLRNVDLLIFYWYEKEIEK